VRQALADTYARQLIGRATADRLRTDRGPAGAVMASLTKLYEAESMWRLAQRAAAILGPQVAADGGRWGTYCWTDVVLSVQSQRIAGGTDEIQRNVIAERGLGLPRDPRPPTGGPQP
jgi:alkylation response protein AidB-like acyl-CoA dehydrogenase